MGIYISAQPSAAELAAFAALAQGSSSSGTENLEYLCGAPKDGLKCPRQRTGSRA
jgi:hypothetical protein